MAAGDGPDRKGVGAETDETRESPGPRQSLTRVEHALSHAAMGVYIFPLKVTDEQKMPLVKWGTESTTDPDTIRRWWAKWPDASIGINCGKSGLVIVDLDVKEGKDGPGDWEKFLDGREVPHTFKVRTRSGGWHGWYRSSGAAYKTSRGEVGPGVDIRGHGGMAVAPGSPGYTWHGEMPLSLDDIPIMPRGILPESNGSTGGHWRELNESALDPRDRAALKALRELKGHGAYLADQDGKEYIAITRPGKLAGGSASIGYLGPGLVKVWSSNWPKLEQDRIYTADDLQAIVNREAPADSSDYAESLFDGDPIPLAPKFVERPFPVDALPDWVADMVTSVAEATQTDPAMAGVTALDVLAACGGGCVEVEVRRGWREPVNIFTASIAVPGERKSAVQAAMTEPLLEAEAELAAASEARRREAEVLSQIAEQQAKAARNIAAKAKTRDEGDRLKAEASSAAEAAAQAAFDVPPITRLIADDATPEAAASLMVEQKRLAIISAEGGVFDILAGRYTGGMPNLDLWLKGHAGDPLRIDRKGREPEYIKRPALTVGLMVQPIVLERIARIDSFRGRGLLDRFLYSEPVSMVGYRDPNAAPVPEPVQEAYHDQVRELAKGLNGFLGGPVAVTMTPEAHDDVVKLLQAVEVELRPDGVLASIRGWGSKFVGAVIRIAGLLHIAELGPEAYRKQIGREHLLAAVRIGTYFKLHALRAFVAMASTGVIADARYLLERIGRIGALELSERDIFNASRGRFGKVAEMRPAIALLVDHGYLAPKPVHRSGGPGRKPSPHYFVHPAVPALSAESAESSSDADSAETAESAGGVEFA